MKVYTSRYQNKALDSSRLEPVGITAYGPRFRLAYALKNISGVLAPMKANLQAYKDGELTDSQYFALYRKQLDKLGLEAIRQELKRVGQGRDVALLCFCNVTEVRCHRTEFAKWWLKATGEIVEEL